jgi:hypothetical protein
MFTILRNITYQLSWLISLLQHPCISLRTQETQVLPAAFFLGSNSSRPWPLPMHSLHTSGVCQLGACQFLSHPAVCTVDRFASSPALVLHYHNQCIFFRSLTILAGMVVHIYNPSTCEAKTGRWSFQGQPDYIARPCLKQNHSINQ